MNEDGGERYLNDYVNLVGRQGFQLTLIQTG